MKDNLQFALILGLFAYVIFLQQCKQGSSLSNEQEFRADTTIVMDTILPAPVIVQMTPQVIPEPMVIYVDSSQKRVPTTFVDTNKHIAVQLYKDSLEDDNLTLYYESLVDGQLLNTDLHYKLKIPKQVTKTVRINTPVPMPTNGLFLNAGVGGNVNTFSSLTLGLQFVSKKGWALGYDYDVLQNVHQVRLGVRLLPFKKKRQIR